MSANRFSVYCISEEVYIKDVVIIETKCCNIFRCVDAV